jgi:hypothetical protein
MELSILLAKVFGLVYLVLALGMLINRAHYRKVFDDMVANGAMTIYGGAMALAAGVFLVSFHNIWIGGWEVIITLFAWAALIKGVLLLLAPKAMLSLTKMLTKNDSVFVLWGACALILGLVLCYFGFLA